MEEYLAFREPIRKSLDMIKADDGADNEPLRTLDSAVKEEMYETMRSAADDMDCGLLQQTYNEMKGFDIPEEERELFDQLGKAVNNYNYDGILELLQN